MAQICRRCLSVRNRPHDVSGFGIESCMHILSLSLLTPAPAPAPIFVAESGSCMPANCNVSCCILRAPRERAWTGREIEVHVGGWCEGACRSRLLLALTMQGSGFVASPPAILGTGCGALGSFSGYLGSNLASWPMVGSPLRPTVGRRKPRQRFWSLSLGSRTWSMEFNPDAVYAAGETPRRCRHHCEVVMVNGLVSPGVSQFCRFGIGGLK